MASTKRADEPTHGIAAIGSFRMTLQAATILALAALYSPLSQGTLAPVYGSIPSAQFHHLGTAVLALLALTRNATIVRWLPERRQVYLQVLSCWIPTIQSLLGRYSGRLGSTVGPVLTELLTYYPLVLLAASCASELLASAQIDLHLHRSLNGTILGLAAYGFFTTIESYAPFIVTAISSLSIYLTRTTIQAIVGAVYFAVLPRKLYIAAILPLLQTVLINYHSPYPLPTGLLNSSLQAQDWRLLERGESITGYVSVLENLDLQYRVLRCDHSLLGGEWLVTEERKKSGITVPEPIYAVFEMLEAVRLVEVSDGGKRDYEANALVIGLGIGTAPKALIAHGINTTVVELDPLVHDFATRYFDLPYNHTAVLQDAVSWVHGSAATLKDAPDSSNAKYDYIIHDVFTGGAEPLPLFTFGFLQDLRSLLSTDGVIAINYAGDLQSVSTRRVLDTINTAFGKQCRMFRDQPPLEESSDSSPGSGGPDAEGDGYDFLNMVIFCVNNPANHPLGFRDPVEADFLGAQSRRHYLLPKPQLELAFPSLSEQDEDGGGGGGDGQKKEGELKLLTTENLKEFERAQVESARRHWKIMRMVMPDFVWERW